MGNKKQNHATRGRRLITGLLIKVFVEFQHKIALVVEPRGRSLVMLPYRTMAAVESTSVISVLLYMTVVEVSRDELYDFARIGSNETDMGPPQPR